jgi:methionyl-tRNA formyltransferase
MRIAILSANEKNALAILALVANELSAQHIDCSVATDHTFPGELPDMVFLLGYDKIVDAGTIARLRGRMAVFHSSDLPKGRGWAPIYTTLASQNPVHTITLCYLAHPVDSGNILLKARIPVPSHYTAGVLRQVGQQVIARMIARYARRFEGDLPSGLKQEGPATYVHRRTPEDAAMEADQPLEALMPHILASETPNAAYVMYRGERFRIVAVPERQDFRDDFSIEEYFGATLDRTVPLSF